MAIAIEALAAGQAAKQGVQSTPSVTKDQWTVIGLLLVLFLLEVLSHPKVRTAITSYIALIHPPKKKSGGND